MKNKSRFLNAVRRRQNALSLSLIAVTALLVGCTNTENGGSFSSDEASTTVDQTAGFQIKATFPSTVTQQVMHAFGAYNSTCTIDPTSAPQDLKCMVEARETDVYYNPLTISVNVPAGMCAYFEERPYFYYNWRPGQGESLYNMTVTDGSVTSCTVSSGAGSTASGGCGSSTGTVSVSGTVTCPFDYSGGGGPNCCIGSYVANVTTITSPTTPGDSPTTSSSSTVGSYGGTLGSCIAGPGQSTLWTDHVATGSYTGFPTSILHYVSTTGYAEVINNRTPIDYVEGNGTTVSISNFYFNWANYLSQGNSVTTTLPTAVDPSALPGGAAVAKTQDSWEFLCEDESHEIIHRIRLYVNEWDTNEQFTAYQLSNGTSGNPSAADTARDGIDCTVGGGITYGYCNDFFSLRDYAAGNTYGAGRGSAIGYFPMDPINDAAPTN